MPEAGNVSDWILKAMVAVAAADGHLDTREVALIQEIYEAREGRKLTADAIARAADANARDTSAGDDLLAQFAAAGPMLDTSAKEEIIRASYLVLLADKRISGEERKTLKDIAMALKIPEIHFGAILEDLVLSPKRQG